MEEIFSLIANGNCAINVRARSRLPCPAPGDGAGQRSRFSGILISSYVKIIANPAEGARLGKRDRAGTLTVQLPLAINGNFSSISRAKY